MTQKFDALEPLEEFDEQEVTKPGRENFTVKELLDGDAYSSFGKMAAEVVLLRTQVKELTAIVNKQTKLLNQVIPLLKNKGADMVKGGGIVGGVLAIIEVLKFLGVLK